MSVLIYVITLNAPLVSDGVTLYVIVFLSAVMEYCLVVNPGLAEDPVTDVRVLDVVRLV